jgi:antirestriction protein ArdC
VEYTFGSESYSKEELIAEMGAAMLCGIAGIERCTLSNSAAYLKSWIGLPPEQADKIFDAFFTTKSQGTGKGTFDRPDHH